MIAKVFIMLAAVLLGCCLTSASAQSLDSFLVWNSFFDDDLAQYQHHQLQDRWDWLSPRYGHRQARRQHRQSAAMDMFDALSRQYQYQQQHAQQKEEMELRELPEHYEVELAMPGMRKEDVRIRVQGDQLLIQAERSISHSQPQQEAITQAPPSSPAPAPEQLLAQQVDALAQGLEITEQDSEEQTKEALPVATPVEAPPSSSSLSCKQQQQQQQQQLPAESSWTRRKTIQRSFTLGEDVDGSRLRAELKDGLLTLRLPKRTVQPPLDILVEVM